MASKKLKQALMAGLAGAALVGVNKMKANALKKAVTDTGDFGSEARNNIELIKGDTQNTRGAVNSMIQKRTKNRGMGIGFDSVFGDLPAGANKGKMIKANNGTMVIARGNKLARSKPTKLS